MYLKSVDLDNFPTSETAKRMLERISPIYDRSYVMKWLLQVMGIELDEMKKYVKALPLQRFPEVATWGIGYLEQKYGLTSDESKSLEERRVAVIAARPIRGSITPYRIEQIIKGIAHADVSIEEHASESRFTVYINTTPYKADNVTINKTLDKLKPSHLIYHTIYSTETYSDIYIAGVIQKSKIITLPTIDAIYRKTLNGALNTGGVLQYSKSITLKEG